MTSITIIALEPSPPAMSFFQRPSQQQQQQQQQQQRQPGLVVGAAGAAAQPLTFQQPAPPQQQQVQHLTPQQQQQQLMLAEEPTIWQRLSQGALMGTAVGATMGFLGAGFQILRAGPGPRGVMGTLSQSMLAMGATFGAIMSIGAVIRTEGKDEARWLAAARRGQLQRLPASARAASFQ